jgi:hypothetical protein
MNELVLYSTIQKPSAVSEANRQDATADCRFHKPAVKGFQEPAQHALAPIIGGKEESKWRGKRNILHR